MNPSLPDQETMQQRIFSGKQAGTEAVLSFQSCLRAGLRSPDRTGRGKLLPAVSRIHRVYDRIIFPVFQDQGLLVDPGAQAAQGFADQPLVRLGLQDHLLKIQGLIRLPQQDIPDDLTAHACDHQAVGFSGPVSVQTVRHPQTDPVFPVQFQVLSGFRQGAGNNIHAQGPGNDPGPEQGDRYMGMVTAHVTEPVTGRDHTCGGSQPVRQADRGSGVLVCIGRHQSR